MVVVVVVDFAVAVFVASLILKEHHSVVPSDRTIRLNTAVFCLWRFCVCYVQVTLVGFWQHV